MAGVTVRDDVPIGATMREPSVGATVREEAPVGATVREGEQGPRPFGPLLRLPSALADRFVVERQLLTRGNEADLLVAGDRRTGDRVVIKLYRLGIEPKADVMAMLPRLDARYVVRQLEHGHSDGHAYEVMEFVPEGDLAALLNAGLPAAALRDMIAQITETIAYLHGLRPAVVHRDMKPDNILVRRRNPLELVLADFSFASVVAGGSRVGTTRHRTIRYAAPEAAAGDISAAADWWSLGIITAEAALGRHPFGDATDEAVSIHLVNRRPVPLDGVADGRVKLLCQGLLCYDQKHRWGMAQVREWLAGGNPPIIEDIDEIKKLKYAPYRIGGRDCWTLRELAAGLVANWDEAVKRIGRRTDIERWLLQDLKDQDTYNRFLDLNDSTAFRLLDPSARLSLWLPMLDHTLPPIVDGQPLTPDRFIAFAQAAAAGRSRWLLILQPGYGEQLAQLSGATWLVQAYTEWGAAAAEARSLDDQLKAAEPNLQPFQSNERLSLYLLLLLRDPAVRKASEQRYQNEIRSGVVRACRWAAPVLNQQNPSVAQIWVFEARLDPIKQGGELARAETAKQRRVLVGVLAGIIGIAFLYQVITSSLKDEQVAKQHREEIARQQAEQQAKQQNDAFQAEQNRLADYCNMGKTLRVKMGPAALKNAVLSKPTVLFRDFVFQNELVNGVSVASDNPRACHVRFVRNRIIFTGDVDFFSLEPYDEPTDARSPEVQPLSSLSGSLANIPTSIPRRSAEGIFSSPNLHSARRHRAHTSQPRFGLDNLHALSNQPAPQTPQPDRIVTKKAVTDEWTKGN